MYSEDFSKRLAILRNQKGVSARDMSLSIGQNPGYINNIEMGKALPSMASFFFICDYLEISPKQFFDTDTCQPKEIYELEQNLKKLSPELLRNISEIVLNLVNNNPK
jgi:transcriptional regulator with XRE-family HTH domain